MNYRSLGDTGIIVSEIGFGAWGIGGETSGPTSYGPTNDDESRLALRRAFDLGITFYDTSDLYGYGHSEELIGEVLRDVRSKVVIASKVGFLEHNGPQNFSSKHITESLHKTLRRLRTDYLDLYQLHSPPLETVKSDSEILHTLNTLKKEGKIRAVGISVRSPNDATAAIEDLKLKSIQVNFNMIDQRILENNCFELAKNEKIGIIARTPLAFGFLTDTLKNTEFSANDHRASWSGEQIARWKSAPEAFSFLLHGKNISPAQAALNFCLSFSAVSTVIPGMLTPREVDENVAVSQLPRFTSEELGKAYKIYKETNFFIGGKK